MHCGSLFSRLSSSVRHLFCGEYLFPQITISTHSSVWLPDGSDRPPVFAFPLPKTNNLRGRTSYSYWNPLQKFPQNVSWFVLCRDRPANRWQGKLCVLDLRWAKVVVQQCFLYFFSYYLILIIIWFCWTFLEILSKIYKIGMIVLSMPKRSPLLSVHYPNI